MLNFFRKTPKSAPTTDHGDRIYAVGDIHGRYDLLRRMISKIDSHQASLPLKKPAFLILLGDIIDRGPDSAKIIAYLRKLGSGESNLITLMGNHEDLMTRALRGEPGFMRAWLRTGGRETLMSYGLSIEECPDEFDLLQRARDAVPQKDIEWISNLPLYTRSGDYFFCHAGIKPGIPLKRQNRSDLLWIRSKFLDYTGSHGVVVVHGHSISETVQAQPNRIGIDTGAYRTGVLTCLYVENEEQSFLSVHDEDSLPSQGADTPTPSVPL